jgi:hypothetical protein
MPLTPTKRPHWAFNVGQAVYVRGWPAQATAIVTALCDSKSEDNWGRIVSVPAYLVVDDTGDEWLIAQMRLSSTTIRLGVVAQ